MKRILLVSAIIGLLVSSPRILGLQEDRGRTQRAADRCRESQSVDQPSPQQRAGDVPLRRRQRSHRRPSGRRLLPGGRTDQPAAAGVRRLRRRSHRGLHQGSDRSLPTEWKEFRGLRAQAADAVLLRPRQPRRLSNAAQVDVWKERFGQRYYHFVYKDVLFLAVNSEDPYEDKEDSRIGKEQIEYFQKVLADNAEGALDDRLPAQAAVDAAEHGKERLARHREGARRAQATPSSAGHIHRYQKFVRQGMNYYQLATTGGGSRLRGVAYGEFDHVAWVTMKTDRRRSSPTSCSTASCPRT